MNRSRYLYIGALGLSTVAFLVDRFLLSEPASVEAALLPVQSVAPPVRSLASTVKPATVASTGHDPVLAWLDGLPNRSTNRDVFSWAEPQPGWLQQWLADRLGRGKSAPEDQARADQQIQAFLSSHTLQSTLAADEPMAVVDGAVLSVGERLDDFTLIAVQSDRATFRHVETGQHAILRLPQPVGASQR